MGFFNTTTVRDTGISVTPKPEDRPKFARVYRIVVGDGFRVEVELKTWSVGRSNWSTLTQKNGKYIMFDADAVADKILDRELYPLVQDAVNQILAMDRVYLATNPSEFTDETGTTWQRKQS